MNKKIIWVTKNLRSEKNFGLINIWVLKHLDPKTIWVTEPKDILGQKKFESQKSQKKCSVQRNLGLWSIKGLGSIRNFDSKKI